jgi:hypothetical protein
MAIKFDGESSYRDETSQLLASIEANSVGQVIISSIRRSGKDLTIQPYLDQDCDARTTGNDPRAGAPKGVGGTEDTKAPWFRGDGDNAATRGFDERNDVFKDRAGRLQRATGGGTDVTLKFSPSTWAPGEHACYGGHYGSQPDEVLLHELVHASRYMHGLLNAIPTEDNSLRGYDNEEEFVAIVTTNVYISSKGGTQLRGPVHSDHAPLKAPLDTSAGFLKDPMNWKLMNIFRLTWTTEFLGLTNVLTAPFNPFRELSIQLRQFPVGNSFERMYTEALMPAWAH